MSNTDKPTPPDEECAAERSNIFKQLGVKKVSTSWVSKESTLKEESARGDKPGSMVQGPAGGVASDEPEEPTIRESITREGVGMRWSRTYFCV